MFQFDKESHLARHYQEYYESLDIHPTEILIVIIMYNTKQLHNYHNT